MNITTKELLDSLWHCTDGHDCLAVAVKLLRECHAAGFITDAGVVRKVAGVLPITADGFIVGAEPVLFGPQGQPVIASGRDCAVSAEVRVYDGQRTREAWPWRDCFTEPQAARKAAAEAARDSDK